MATNFDIFIDRAIEVHGTKYNYSKVDYKWVEKKVIIICPIHWEFLMRPKAHYTDRRWCPECDNTWKSWFHNSQWAKGRKILYFAEFYNDTEKFIKIWVTSEKDSNKRFQKGLIPYKHKAIWEKTLGNANEIEKNIVSRYKQYSYTPRIYFRGHTECFTFSAKENILWYLEEI